MDIKQKSNINKHIKKVLTNNKPIIKTQNFPHTITISKEYKDDEIYKMPLICVAINLEQLKNKVSSLEFSVKMKLISEIIFSISKIFKIYYAKTINISDDQIYAIFSAFTTKEIENAFKCCVELNTLKWNINKRYLWDIKKQIMNELDLSLNFIIAAWYSTENFVLKHSYPRENDLWFVGESITFAKELSKENNLDYEMLFNYEFLFRLSSEFKSIRNPFISFEKLHNKKYPEIIYEGKWLDNDYFEWIKKDAR